MAEAPRVSSRLFPDAAQAGIGNGVVLNQSRVTFHGQRGMVWVMWQVAVTNAGAVAINSVGMQAQGTVVGPLQILRSDGWFDAVVGRAFSGIVALVVVDPPDGSFLELRTQLSGGTINVGPLAGLVTAISFEPGVVAGPVVTVA